MIENKLAKLNRLRVNAGKSELKVWKAAAAKLNEAIALLENAGFDDSLPGAQKVEPITDDPVIQEALKPKEGDEAPKPVLDEDEDDGEPLVKRKPTVQKIPASLARGCEGEDTYTRHSREKLKDIRKGERDAAKADRKKAKVELSDQDKAQIKDEAKSRKGEVDAKKEPEKAARQQKHIADKKAKREAEGKPAKKKETSSDEITVAEMARETGIDPKVARAKLRRHEAKIEKLHTKGQDRWTFPKSAKPTIMAILK